MKKQDFFKIGYIFKPSYLKRCTKIVPKVYKLLLISNNMKNKKEITLLKFHINNKSIPDEVWLLKTKPLTIKHSLMKK
jgi:hypothetical protein